MYGQAEATAQISYLPHELSVECGSIGIAIRGVNFHWSMNRGRLSRSPTSIGELVYSGPNVALGYARSADDLMKGNENGRTLATGDVRDAQRGWLLLVFVGRRKSDSSRSSVIGSISTRQKA